MLYSEDFSLATFHYIFMIGVSFSFCCTISYYLLLQVGHFPFALEFLYYFSLHVSTFHWLSFLPRILTLLFIVGCFSFPHGIFISLFVSFSFGYRILYYLPLQISTLHWLLISFSLAAVHITFHCRSVLFIACFSFVHTILILLLIGDGLQNLAINPKMARKSVNFQKKVEIILINDDDVGVPCLGSKVISK